MCFLVSVVFLSVRYYSRSGGVPFCSLFQEAPNQLTPPLQSVAPGPATKGPSSTWNSLFCFFLSVASFEPGL